MKKNIKRDSFTTNKSETRWRMITRKKQIINCCTMFTCTVFLGMGLPNYSYAAPAGGSITVGTGSIVQQGDAGYDGSNTNINQTSNRLDINWNTFSTTVSEAVTFTQPTTTSVAINRVIGGLPSELRGALNANGRVFVLNDSGITFYGTSQVNVGALVATTAADVIEEGGTYIFSNFGDASVINNGNITVSSGGFAILAAPYVENTGYIQATLGRVELTSTTNLDLRGDGLITYAVSNESLAKIGVNNTGELQAHAGTISISAGVASDIATSVINLDGIIDADSFGGHYNGERLLVTSVEDVNFADGVAVTAKRGVTVTAGNSVTFENKLDTLSSRTGDISIEAGAGGIDIGSLTTGALGFRPGDISLTTNAGGNIKTSSLNITGSSVDSDDAYVSGYISINSDGDVIVDGDITINVSAESTSESSATASATADIYAMGDVSITGNVNIDAKAKIYSSDNSGYYAEADAFLDIEAGQGEEGGDLSIIGDVTVTADVDSFGGTSTASADARVTLSAMDNVGIIGDITVTATTDFEGTDSEAESDAELYIDASYGDIDITGNIRVDSSAIRRGSYSSATADASANLSAGRNINVTGNVWVSARSFLDMDSGEYGYYSEADAYLNMEAGQSEEGGDLTIVGNVIVTADADSIGGTDTASADATVSLEATDNVMVTGDITVTAVTNFEGTESDAEADARLSVDASYGDIDIIGDINVDATATKTGTDSDASADASVDLSAGRNIDVTGDVTVNATAFLNTDSSEYGYDAEAYAYLNMEAGQGEEGGDLTVTGDLAVTADADSFNGTGTASADAEINLESMGNILVTGAIDVDANATIASGDYNADAEADAILHIEADGSINVSDDITVAAVADQSLASSGDYARASVEAVFEAGDDVFTKGIAVSALSDQSGGYDAYNAMTEAQLEVNSESGSIEVEGDVMVDAMTYMDGSYLMAPHTTASAYFNTEEGDDINIVGDVIITAETDISVSGGVFYGSSSSERGGFFGEGSSEDGDGGGNYYTTALLDMFAGGDINIIGEEISVTAQTSLDYTSSSSSDREVVVPFNGANNATAYAELTAGHDLSIVGDISTRVFSEVNNPPEIDGNGKPVPFEGEEEEQQYDNYSFLGLFAGNSITVTGYNDPKSEANDALVQQRFSGDDTVDDDRAELVIGAVGEVRIEEHEDEDHEDREDREDRDEDDDDDVTIIISQIPAPTPTGNTSQNGDSGNNSDGGDDNNDDSGDNFTAQSLNNLAPAAGGEDDTTGECVQMNCGING